MITLYHCPRSRSSGTMWLLEELGLPYEIKIVDVRARDGQKPDYLAINPMGKVPAVKDGDDIITESIAIALFLADKYPSARLAPPINDRRRARYLTLMQFAAMIDGAFVDRMFNREPPPKTPGSLGWGNYERVMNVFTPMISNAAPWLLGDQFTAVDVVLGSCVPWGMAVGCVPDEPPFKEYGERLAARPALQRARAKDTG